MPWCGQSLFQNAFSRTKLWKGVRWVWLLTACQGYESNECSWRGGALSRFFLSPFDVALELDVTSLICCTPHFYFRSSQSPSSHAVQIEQKGKTFSHGCAVFSVGIGSTSTPAFVGFPPNSTVPGPGSTAWLVLLSFKPWLLCWDEQLIVWTFGALVVICGWWQCVQCVTSARQCRLGGRWYSFQVYRWTERAGLHSSPVQRCLCWPAKASLNSLPPLYL